MKLSLSLSFSKTYFIMIAASTKTVADGPKYVQMTLSTMLPGVLVMIWSLRIPYKSKNEANIMRHTMIVPTIS